jgi:hypothetical protein
VGSHRHRPFTSPRHIRCCHRLRQAGSLIQPSTWRVVRHFCRWRKGDAVGIQRLASLCRLGISGEGLAVLLKTASSGVGGSYWTSRLSPAHLYPRPHHTTLVAHPRPLGPRCRRFPPMLLRRWAPPCAPPGGSSPARCCLPLRPGCFVLRPAAAGNNARLGPGDACRLLCIDRWLFMVSRDLWLISF